MRSQNCCLRDCHAALASLFRELDNQNAILGRERDQHHQSNLTVKIQIQSGDFDADVRAQHADNDRQQHRNRDDRALIESHQE